MNGLREPGTILDGKYEIVQRLASGGMGEVYLVRHLHLQELRVVKILRQDLQADPAAQKRFLREARLATQIKHPNIAILYDFSRLEDGSFYMVSEHIEGEDVGDRLRRTGPFSLALAIQLGIQALRGLEAIHASGIIHRDLSPDNLMIMSGRRGQPVLKIIDLGLARTLEADANFEITQVGMFMGKLQYCSPEQAGAASGETLDARSDIYSFGLVLYEMITGFPPFESENQAGFIFKRLSEDPLSLVGRNPQVEVPVEVDRVVRRALERDRERRYPTAIGFIEALEQVVLRMNAAETREIPIWSFPPEARPPETRPPEARRRSSSELSKADRDDLLAQIDRAARRVQESAVDMARVEAALAAGKIEEAERLIAGIEAAQPRAAGLDRARQRLQEMKDVASVHLRVAETEQVLHQYIQRKQLALARLALETLTELRPAHPKRGEYAAAIDLLGKELEQEKRATAALAAGREALARKDLKAARRELDAIARNDPSGKRAASFKEELEAVERDARDQSTADDLRRRLETALAGQRVTDATLALEALARLDMPRVTLDSYRERIEETRRAQEEREQLSRFERLFRKHMDDRDWIGAREVAQDLGQALPASPRAAEMFAEAERLESEHRRHQAVEQGVRQVEVFVEQGDAAKAELALKILLQMDPENRHRKRLEKQVRALAR